MPSPPPRFLWTCAALLVLVACDDEVAPSAQPDAAAEASPSVDAIAPKIRCTAEELAANDKTDGGALEVVFSTGANPAQYTNRCATVKAGASVTFVGSFKQHPLEPAGGDSPNPIPYTAGEEAGGKLVVSLPTAGTFGYQCEFHPTLMYGAIKVIP